MTLRFATAALSVFALSALAATSPAAAEPRSGEDRLAEAIDGRVAGEPTACVPSHPNARFYIIGKTALVYDTGRTIYVNYTRYPDTLDANDLIVIRNNVGTLCRTSRIETRSPSMMHAFGSPLFLTDFVPYRRAD